MKVEELYKILISDNVYNLIKENEENIFELIPELKVCKGFNQNNPWHVYDVYEHTLSVIKNVPSDIVLRLTALFHDLGKPETYIEDENHIGHFPKHWVLSNDIFINFSSKHKLDEKLKEKVSKLILYHDIRYKHLSDEDIIDFLNLFDKQEIKDLYMIKRADLLSQNSKYHFMLKELDEEEQKLRRRKKER